MRSLPDPALAPSVLFVYPRSPHRVDAVEAYAGELLTALNQTGAAQASMQDTAFVGGWFGVRRDSEGRWPAIVLVHYQPFSWGKWGVAPLLVLALARLRLRRDRPKLVVIIHEIFVTPANYRQRLMRLWQRGQLRALLALADTVLVTKEWSANQMRTLTPKPIGHLGVGSLLPDRRASGPEQRRALNIAENEIVLAALGTDLITRRVQHLAECARAVSDAGYRTTLMNLGAGSPAVSQVPREIRLLEPGYLDPEELATWLAAADIYLAPLADGVSTGKTTLMAALAHGLPVIGSSGEATEELLRCHPDALTLVPAGKAEAMAAAAVVLAADPRRRLQGGEAALDLYRTHFDWPVIGARLVELLQLRGSTLR